MVKLAFGTIGGILLFATVTSFFLGMGGLTFWLAIFTILVFIIGRNVINACSAQRKDPQ